MCVSLGGHLQRQPSIMLSLAYAWLMLSLAYAWSMLSLCLADFFRRPSLMCFSWQFAPCATCVRHCTETRQRCTEARQI